MGTYITQGDVEGVFGTVNVAAWSDLTGGRTADTTRIASGISYAEAYVENRFRRSAYSVPFVATGSGHDAMLTQWIAVIAGEWLYQSRQVRNDKKDNAGNTVTRLRQRTEDDMTATLAGSMAMAESQDYPDEPTAPYTL